MSTKDGVITAFPGGIPTQADQDLWTAEYEAYLPTKAWKQAMAGTDAIPRWAEDIFDALPLEIRDVVNPVTKKMINDKKALREIKPV
jgi:hypothetical protein